MQNSLGLFQRKPKACFFAVTFVRLTALENPSHLLRGASRRLRVSVSHAQIQATISVSAPRPWATVSSSPGMGDNKFVRLAKSVSAGGVLS